MPLEIKIDVITDGKVALWHRRDVLDGKPATWSQAILGNSPREVVLKFADTLQCERVVPEEGALPETQV